MTWHVCYMLQKEDRTKYPGAYSRRADRNSEVYLACTGKWVAWCIPHTSFDTAEEAMKAVESRGELTIKELVLAVAGAARQIEQPHFDEAIQEVLDRFELVKSQAREEALNDAAWECGAAATFDSAKTSHETKYLDGFVAGVEDCLDRIGDLKKENK